MGVRHLSEINFIQDDFSFAEDVTIIIFGYSRLGMRLCDELISQAKRNVYFCDNSVNKIGQIYRNVLVLSVEHSVRVAAKKAYFICSLFHENSMKKQLLDLGVASETIFSAPTILIEEEKLEMQREKGCCKEKFQFEVDIAMHCNLKCKSCHHFSPLAEKEVTDFHVFRNDFERLANLFGEDVDRIYLLGGEPLLNSDISIYLGTARKSFLNATIELITNGILLSKMSAFFWNCCKENRIKISVTKYPIKMDYLEIEAMCKAKGVEFEFFGSAVNDKHMSYYPLDTEGNQNVKENFYSCNMANKCITLKNGILYPCVLPANIIHFNRYFGKSLNVSEKDGVNIYEAKSKDEILDFLSKPIPFCRYCNVKRRTYDNRWEQSRLEIEEWT